MGLMITSVIALLPLLFLLGSPSVSLAADINWKVFLKNYQQPVYSVTSREGEEVTFPRIILPGAVSQAQGLADALENTRFLVPRLPDTRSIEIRVVLNVSGSQFEPVRQKAMFLNMSVTPYRDGQLMSPCTFPQPMVLSIPVTGLNYLLAQCGFSRSDDITLAFDAGGTFTRDGIITSNMTSGLSANIMHLSTIVGSTCELLDLPPTKSLSTWGKIKLLFR